MSPEVETEVLSALEEWRAARAEIFAGQVPGTISQMAAHWLRLSNAEHALMNVAKKVSHAIQ